MQISASFCIKKNWSYRTHTTYVQLIDYFDSLTRLQVARINYDLFPNTDS